MSLPPYRKIRELMSQLPPMPEKELIVGWRGWTLGDDGYLRSLSYNHFAWPKREAADCNITPYQESNCQIEHTGGIHAYKLRESFLADRWTCNVVGEVWLWGQVIEHEHGWRAQYAYPKSFQVRPGFDPVKVMQLEEDYGVPVTFAEDLDRQRAQWMSPFSKLNTIGAANVTSPWYLICPPQ